MKVALHDLGVAAVHVHLDATGARAAIAELRPHLVIANMGADYTQDGQARYSSRRHGNDI